MNLALGLRTLALLAFVAAMTALIVTPDLVGSTQPGHAFATLVALGRA